MELIHQAYYFSVGVSTLVALVLCALATVSRYKGRMLSLCVICIMVTAFQYLSAQLIVEPDVLQQVELRRLRNFYVMLFPAVLLCFLYSYKKSKWDVQTLYGFLLIGCVFSVANYLLPYTTRFANLPALQQVEFDGVNYYVMVGEASWWSHAWFLYFFIGMALALFIAKRLFHAGHKPVALALGVYFVIQTILAFFVYLANWGLYQSVPLVGFGFLIFIGLMCAALIYEFKLSDVKLRQRTKALREEVYKRGQIEKERDKLIQLVAEDPIATHVVNLQGEVEQANAASKRFWHSDLAENRFNLVEFLRHSFESHQFVLNLHKNNSKLPEIQLNKVDLTHWSIANKINANAWLKIYIFPLHDRNNQVTHFCIRIKDVTQEKYVEQAINKIAQGVVGRGDNFYLSMVENLSQIFPVDYVFIAQLEQQQTTAKTLAVAYRGKIVDNFTYALEHTPCEQAKATGVCWYPKGVQDEYPKDTLLIEMDIQGYLGIALTDAEGHTIGLLTLLSVEELDIGYQGQEILNIFAARASSELQMERAEQEIRNLAYYDYLTQLPNRASLLAKLSSYLQRNKENFALLLIDLDNFKFVNDALGNDVADEILRTVGHRLASLNEALVARYGGDEFVIICQPQSADNITLYAQRLAHSIIQLISQPIQVGERIVNIAASAGICLFPLHSFDKLEILRFAETALMQSKELGRGQFYVFDPAIQHKVEQRISLEQDLKRAIAQREFSLLYQPQYNAEQQIYGAEVLIRWISDQNGFVSPAEFIPLAEETGLIHAIGDWVLETALLQMSVLNQFECFQRLSINVSAWQFADHKFAKKLIAQVDKLQIDPNKITLELTETGLLQNVDEAKNKLAELRKVGFKIALDDFGTGYSSLSYLRELPLDELKIDKAFIDEVDGIKAAPLVESMVSIAKHLNLWVVAEGVETQEQYLALDKMGCDHFQGYYFSKPITAKQLVEKLTVTAVSEN
ncbi:EAL domain-containing protein [Catenovulum agarivorans]|uniref:EAL domain-containing protein n=1 Tax=Catenovulum agarivorans TaxID=1172192 RepID=UPI0002F2391E|nr:EAL domain-containing protein [Catenovulum agarivorans]